MRRRLATIFVKPRACLRRQGLKIATANWSIPQGKPVSVEFLIPIQGDERGMLFYKPYLERLGMTVNIRTVDSVQYQNRLRSFDFDITTAYGDSRCRRATSSATSSARKSADRPGSRNLPGIKNPAVDALIDRIIFAKDRAELVAAARRWIGYCSGTATSSRNSPPDFSAPRAGTASAIRSRCPNTAFPVSRRVVVRRRKGSQDGKRSLKDSPHGASQSPARAWPRRRRAGRGAASGRPPPEDGSETHGLSVFGDLKYPADFHHFDYVN